MPDTLTIAERSVRMAQIRHRDTKPEMLVRRLIHSMGYRYRLGGGRLPGRPDLVFRPRRAVIFVHGCFWHRHNDPVCKQARLPKSRSDFWVPKLEANRVRDAKNERELTRLGWRILVLWECEIKERERLSTQIREFLDGEIS